MRKKHQNLRLITNDRFWPSFAFLNERIDDDDYSDKKIENILKKSKVTRV